ncbi:hypothetical protein HMPREF3216_00244 [Gardnerella vaginalis]|uniref:Uncharacterized protein n=1 Tax=Gardnerella vaginalis TaxID=2702 RepID=A0A133NRT1_GARVA|nr:hypothetical protein HMPREF3216_00244 [Gardnerella vaginalis]
MILDLAISANFVQAAMQIKRVQNVLQLLEIYKVIAHHLVTITIWMCKTHGILLHVGTFLKAITKTTITLLPTLKALI